MRIQCEVQRSSFQSAADHDGFHWEARCNDVNADTHELHVHAQAY